jgi:hypothetical protein
MPQAVYTGDEDGRVVSYKNHLPASTNANRSQYEWDCVQRER